MKKLNRYRIFHFLVMAYLVAAFSWWAILLTKRNNEIYNLKKEALTHNGIGNLESIEREYTINKKMVLGEGLVFALSIILGLVLINRAFWSELKLNSRLNNFLLSVTHELKTPITSLKLINKTLSTKKIDESKQKELLKTSYEESERLEKLINNILTAAQMDSNYIFNFEIIDISDLLNLRIHRFKRLNENVSFLADFNKGLKLKGDQEALTKLIDNLIDNAIKYSSDKKEIIISAKESEERIVISIADNGIGIEDKEKKKILDKFYRIGNENVRSSKGTGLGLFIVKEIASAHKASIQILDNNPQGSIFEINFPHA